MVKRKSVSLLFCHTTYFYLVIGFTLLFFYSQLLSLSFHKVIVHTMVNKRLMIN